MAAGESEQFNNEQISAFAEKLEAWGHSLPEKEQPLFSALVARAASNDGEEVAGFMISLGAVAAAQQTATQASTNAYQKAAENAAKMAAMASGTVAAQQAAAQSAQATMR